ncbi:FxSxx-COOH system tetratricopeptide repeat protein [Actinoplanes regularis]|uniref:ATP-, maltotriose- and DNA-dependent transcriptional regulator MalT n=1 Tax=Actinoplanes regularis TaxID=52697 RepID=A0A239A6L3_9ACTN|nr:FxSxx-COOH system tetratricopeptide repeat protein [Actinoplanes regularis]GIE87069.1 ATP-binding protein [Actinoplanes regularis]SNR91072.1 ATP-, maltotriose- and DNA-dependent transcriptional regulator MalT [Actinoplanes regularis]
MAIPLPGLDKLPVGPVRSFVEALHDRYDAAGQPAARVISRDTHRLPHGFETVSHETVSATLRASNVPSWEKVRSIVHVLAGRAPSGYDPRDLDQRMIELWQQARRATQAGETGVPADVVSSRPPPHDPVPGPVVLPPVHRRPASGVRPAAVPEFAGRETLIEAMHTALSTGPDVRLVLYGPVGAGKTQAVLRYLERHADGTPVWWVPAGTAESARASLLELAVELGLEPHHRVERIVRRVLDLAESGRIPHLLVFDDLSAPDLASLVPNGGHVVITTRDPALGHDGSSLGIEVTDLDSDDAGRLLRQHEPDAAAEAITDILSTYGRSPLALAQVVAWSRATGAPLAAAAGADPIDRLTTVPVEGYHSSAAWAVLFTMDRLEAASRSALLLLNTLACFAPVPVSKELLVRDLAAGASIAGPEVPGDPVAMNMALVELCRHGMARLTGDDDRIEVLPPARIVARRAMSGEELSRARAYAHALLAAADPGWPDDQKQTDLYREISAHVRSTGLVDSRHPGARLAVYHQIRFHYLAGDNATACELGEQADQRWRDNGSLAADDHLVLRTSQEWANALRALGRYDEARELTLGAISQLRLDPDYGENHPYTLAMASSQAADLRIAGDYQRALRIDRETLQRCYSAFPQDHPRTTMSGHNLAISLRLSGDFREAEKEDRVALRRHEKAFGDDNWRTLLSINALAEDLNGQGRYRDVLSEVEPLVTRIEQRDRAEGRRRTRMDRGLILAQRAIALALRGIGRFGEALARLEAVHAECVDLFGEDNPHALALRMSHANTLHLLGRTEDSSREMQQVHNDYRDMFGAANPLTVAAGINLANVLRARGEHAAALNIDRVSSEALRETVGRDHPFAVAAEVNLASDYALDSHPHRLAASRRAMELAKQVHPTDHPNVVAAEANLALDLGAAGEPSAAVKHRQAIQHLRGIYNPDHPITAMAARGVRIDCVLEPPMP